MATKPARYCSDCGHGITSRVPQGDNRVRDCCDQCGAIHYVNPRPVVGTIPIWRDKVLLCKRAIEPRYGFWTLPAGFMEIGETTCEGALRETLEEAGARVELGPLFSMLDVPHVEQVHIFFRAELRDERFAPGTESLDVRLYTEAEIPWRDLAFRTVATTLRLYFEDRARGVYGTHVRQLTQVAERPEPRAGAVPDGWPQAAPAGEAQAGIQAGIQARAEAQADPAPK